MTTNSFGNLSELSERDRSVAELVARIALHADVAPALAQTAGFSDGQVSRLRDAVSTFEKQLVQQNPTLSSLLASTSKSKCCS